MITNRCSSANSPCSSRSRAAKAMIGSPNALPASTPRGTSSHPVPGSGTAPNSSSTPK